MFNTRIKTKIEVKNFMDLIKKCGEEQIECTDHTFFHFSREQRKTYNESFVKNILLKETPFLVGIQFNNNHALFHDYKDKVLKMIIHINHKKIHIITFYFIQKWQIPKI